ncbi:hypothetical protein UFOVP233_63 [uncultured Caudovirales phage]|uniref:Uncharacterized protein n=1 Tax=uncultured Caudovirales phage TaxID=2100421 RepID=A0A6J7WR48_9CAUD|nr:hypothetical protein UFOVP233_63 [uncultured Caudovirales phage]
MTFEKMLPFTPFARFEVFLPFTIDAHTYAPGEILNSEGLTDTLLRQLYEQRKIGVVGPDYERLEKAKEAEKRAQKAEAAASAPKPQPKAEAAPSAAPAAPEATTEAPAYRIKHAGLGGYKVIDAKGQPIGPGFKTKAEAEAEIARLTAS